MAKNLRDDLCNHPFVEVVARMIAWRNPDSTLFDLRDELQQSLKTVEKLSAQYTESTRLTDTTTPPV